MIGLGTMQLLKNTINTEIVLESLDSYILIVTQCIEIGLIDNA